MRELTSLHAAMTTGSPTSTTATNAASGKARPGPKRAGTGNKDGANGNGKGDGGAKVKLETMEDGDALVAPGALSVRPGTSTGYEGAAGAAEGWGAMDVDKAPPTRQSQSRSPDEQNVSQSPNHHNHNAEPSPPLPAMGRARSFRGDELHQQYDSRHGAFGAGAFGHSPTSTGGFGHSPTSAGGFGHSPTSAGGPFSAINGGFAVPTTTTSGSGARQSFLAPQHAAHVDNGAGGGVGDSYGGYRGRGGGGRDRSRSGSGPGGGYGSGLSLNLNHSGGRGESFLGCVFLFFRFRELGTLWTIFYLWGFVVALDAASPG
jgi:hypothetical protein